jgi:hypothetical protein
MSSTVIKCAVCKTEFKHFSSYKTHVIKFHSQQNNINSTVDETKSASGKSDTLCKTSTQPISSFNCECCNKTFSTKYSLARHVKKYCKSKQQVPSTPKSFPLLQVTPETIAAIAELIKATASSTVTGSNNTNSSITNQTDNSSNKTNNQHIGDNITNNNNLLINQDIKINPLGKENLDHITEADKLEFLHLGSGAVPALARAILELPENRNMAICDKKAGKVMFVNRKGKVEIANLDKVIGWFTDDNIGRINNYITEYDDKFSPNDKLIQRLKILQGHETIDTDDEEEHDNKYQAYFIACSSQIRDAVELHSKPALKNIKRYRDVKSKELSGHQIPNIQLPTLN